MSSLFRFSVFGALLFFILPTMYVSCVAQVRPMTIIPHAITASSCTIGVAEINNGVLTSCTVQITLSSSLFSSASVFFTTHATLTRQTPHTTFAWSRGVVARIDIVDITPVITPAWCFNISQWAFPHFISNTFSASPAEVTDSRVMSIPSEPPLDAQDSLNYFMYTVSSNSPPLRFISVIDSTLGVLAQQGYPLRDVWVRDFHLGLCSGDLVAVSYVYAFIRLRRPSPDFITALRQAVSSARFLDVIQAPFSTQSVPSTRQTIGQMIGFTTSYQFTRYYNFTRTTSVGGTSQPERLQVQIAPQPIEGQATMTITTPSALTADIRLVNMLGQTIAVLAQGQRLSAGTTTLPIASTGLASGVYAVQVVSSGRILHTQSVVVTR